MNIIFHFLRDLLNLLRHSFHLILLYMMLILYLFFLHHLHLPIHLVHLHLQFLLTSSLHLLIFLVHQIIMMLLLFHLTFIFAILLGLEMLHNICRTISAAKLNPWLLPSSLQLMPPHIKVFLFLLCILIMRYILILNLVPMRRLQTTLCGNMLWMLNYLFYRTVALGLYNLCHLVKVKLPQVVNGSTK